MERFCHYAYNNHSTFKLLQSLRKNAKALDLNLHHGH